jgi:hypothetical protein
MNISYLEKYKPKNSNEIIGNQKIINEVIKKWLNVWEKEIPNKKGILISGDSGIGKTLIIELLLNEMNYNSSVDYEEILNKKYMFSILKTLKSVFNIKKNSIVIDNVETYKNTDIQLFNEYLKETRIPILFICNNRYDIKLKQISTECLDVKLLPPTNNEIFIFLNKIIQKEKIIIKNEDIYMLINHSKNDIRNILINLEFKINERRMITKKDYSEKNIFVITNNIFSQETDYQIKYVNFLYDYELIQLMIFENYIDNIIKSNKNMVQNLGYISEASNHLSDACIFQKENNYDNKYYVGNSCIFSTLNCHNIIFPKFTVFLSYISKKNKINDSIIKLNEKINNLNSKLNFRLDYKYFFDIILFHCFKKENKKNKQITDTIAKENFFQKLKYYNLDLKTDIEENLNNIIMTANIPVIENINFNYKKIKEKIKEKTKEKIKK